MRILKDSEQLKYPSLGSFYSQIGVFWVTFNKKQWIYKKGQEVFFESFFFFFVNIEWTNEVVLLYKIVL